MNKSLADLAHDIISLAIENNSKAEKLLHVLRNYNNQVIPNELLLIVSTIECMDADSLSNEMRLIFARLSRRRTELQRIENIISSLPNSVIPSHPSSPSSGGLPANADLKAVAR